MTGPGPSDVWVIEPRRAGLGARAREVWQYRRLLRFFGTRALQKLYMKTVLGWAWLFIRPLFPLAVTTLVFGGLLKVGSDGLPYFLFLVVGMACWEVFASSVMWATRSLEMNRGFLTRIYVPRIILPIAALTPGLFNFVIYMAVLLGAATYYYVTAGIWYVGNGVGTLWAPLAMVLALFLAVAVGLWTSVPALVARDVRFTLGYVLGFWVFLTPVMYPLSAVPEKWRWAAALNPMTAIVETFKHGMLGVGIVDPQHLATSVGIVAATFVSGLAFFLRAEVNAADKV